MGMRASWSGTREEALDGERLDAAASMEGAPHRTANTSCADATNTCCRRRGPSAVARAMEQLAVE